MYPKLQQMRYKFPQVLCFQDWDDLYNMHDMGDNGFVYKEPFKYDETGEMKEARKNVLAALEKNKEAILEVEEKMVKYLQLDTLKDPPIYLAMIKDTRNREAETLTLTAKTFWPLMHGKRKEIRIYIGKESEYPEYKKDYVAKIAKQKMQEHLLQRYNNGELK